MLLFKVSCLALWSHTMINSPTVCPPPKALCHVVMYCTVLLQYFYHSKQIGTTFSTKTNILSNVCTLRLLPLSPKEEVRTGSTPTPIHSQFDT